MSTEYRFEGPPGAGGAAFYASDGRAMSVAKVILRKRWRGSGDLVKVFRRTLDGEVFMGHAEYDSRKRVVLWYPSGK